MCPEKKLGAEDRERLEAIVRQVASCEFIKVSLKETDDGGDYEFSYFNRETGRQEQATVRLYCPWDRTLEDALYQSESSFWMVSRGKPFSDEKQRRMRGISRRIRRVIDCMAMGLTVSL